MKKSLRKRLRCRWYFSVRLTSREEPLILRDLKLLPEMGVTSKDIREVSHLEGYLIKQGGQWNAFALREEAVQFIRNHRK